jgi:hypothetical protein
VELVQIAWATSATALSSACFIGSASFITLRERRRHEKTRAIRWSALTDTLARLHADPDDAEANAALAHTIRFSRRDTDDAIEILATILPLYVGDRRIVEALIAAGLPELLQREVVDGSRTKMRAGLLLAGMLGDYDLLSAILMRATDEDTEVRREAVQALSAMAPLAAMHHLIGVLREEGPWALEQFVSLLSDGHLDAWLDAESDGNEMRRRRLQRDVIEILASFLDSDVARGGFAAIDGLSAIDHRSARHALATALSTAPTTVGHAAARALSESEEGRNLLRTVTGLPGDAQHIAYLALGDAPRANFDEDDDTVTPIRARLRGR